MRGHPQWEFEGTMDPTIESSILICMEEADDLMMTAIGVSTQGRPQIRSTPAILL
jgi:hypothetical protein